MDSDMLKNIYRQAMKTVHTGLPVADSEEFMQHPITRGVDTLSAYASPLGQPISESIKKALTGEGIKETLADKSTPEQLAYRAAMASIGKQPWQMTQRELIEHQINRNIQKIQEAQANLDKIMGGAPIPQGNLTRKGDLNYTPSKEFYDKYGKEITLWSSKIKKLDRINKDFSTEEGKKLVEQFHKDSINKALSEGKQVPKEVLDGYKDFSK